MNRNVRQGGRAVAAYARTAEAVDTDIEILGGGHTDVDEAAAAHLGVVLTTCSGRNHKGLVGIVTVAEPAAECTDFKVSVLRIVRTFEDEIRGDVVRVVGQGAVETATRTGISDEEVCVGVSRPINVLCLFERYCCGEAVFEGLLDANARLTLPAETDLVRSIDGHRQVLRTVVGALLGLGYE